MLREPPPRKEIARTPQPDGTVKVTFEGLEEPVQMSVTAADHEARWFKQYRPANPGGGPPANVQKGQVNPVGGMGRATRDKLAIGAHEGADVVVSLAKGEGVTTKDGAVLMPDVTDVIKANEYCAKHSLSPLLPVLPEWMEDDLADVLAEKGVSIELATEIGNALSEKFKARAQGMGGQDAS